MISKGKALADQKRHREKMKEAIRKGLKDLIRNQDLITGDPNKPIRIPMPELYDYHFRPGQPDRGLGQGKGSKPGDVVSIEPKDEAGDSEAGDNHQEVFEVSRETLIDWIMEDLKLPELDLSKKGGMESEEDKLVSSSKVGTLSRLDKKQTIIQAIKRRNNQGSEADLLTNEDLRYRAYITRYKPSTQAVVVLLRDASGSITSEMRYLALVTSLVFVRGLKKAYPSVAVRWFLHDTEAVETDENTFFSGKMGGTRFYESYEKVFGILDQEHPESTWNRYLLHFSDGEALTSDLEKTEQFLSDHVATLNRFCYADLNGYPVADSHNLMKHLPKAARKGTLTRDAMKEVLTHFMKDGD